MRVARVDAGPAAVGCVVALAGALFLAEPLVGPVPVGGRDVPVAALSFVVLAVAFDLGAVVFYRWSRPSASGLDPEGEGRRLITHPAETAGTVATWVKDLNPKQLPAVARKCDPSQNPRLRRGATGVAGRGGAADPHGRTERSGVNSNRPISGRSRGIKFTCDGTPRFGTCGQNGEAAGLVPAVLHRGP
jgi:hypothetical protein